MCTARCSATIPPWLPGFGQEFARCDLPSCEPSRAAGQTVAYGITVRIGKVFLWPPNQLAHRADPAGFRKKKPANNNKVATAFKAPPTTAH